MLSTMGNSSIEWTDKTWNPLRAELQGGRWGYHCEPVSPGCKNCYAERMNLRTFPTWGTGLQYKVQNRDSLVIHLDQDELLRPLRWKAGQRVFVCSMTDLFADFVPDSIIDQMFCVMAMSPHLTFQVLTKRSKRLPEYFRSPADLRSRWADVLHDSRVFPGDPRRAVLGFPSRAGVAEGLMQGWRSLALPNVQLGVSAEDQHWAEQRIPDLLRTPAAARFVSYEPALGPIDFTRIETRPGAFNSLMHGASPGLDWIVIGGESGPGARPFDARWAESVIEQCRLYGTAVFMKQFGAKPLSMKGEPWKLQDKKGGDMNEWPEYFRIREFAQELEKKARG